MNIGSYLRNTLVVDKNNNSDEACMDIYRVLRPGEPPTPETSRNLFNNLFFNNTRYDLSDVGRVKLNRQVAVEGGDALECAVHGGDLAHVPARQIAFEDGSGTMLAHIGDCSRETWQPEKASVGKGAALSVTLLTSQHNSRR